MAPGHYVLAPMGLRAHGAMAYGIWPHEDVSVWCGKLGFWLWSSQAQAAMDAAEDTHIANIAQIPPYDSDIDLMVFGLSET